MNKLIIFILFFIIITSLISSLYFDITAERNDNGKCYDQRYHEIIGLKCEDKEYNLIFFISMITFMIGAIALSLYIFLDL